MSDAARSDRTRSRRFTIPLAIVALFAGSFAGSAWANARFPDVPPSNPFFDDIEAVTDAGITTGYGDGTFRPTEAISRQTMAAMVHRGLGRVDGRAHFTTTTSTSLQNLATATITAGAESGTGGYVAVFGTASFYTDSEASCPCRVSLQMTDGTVSAASKRSQMSGEASADGFTYTSVSNMWVYPIAPGQTKTFRLQGNRGDALSGSPSTAIGSSIVALYVPFDGEGGHDL